MEESSKLINEEYKNEKIKTIEDLRAFLVKLEIIKPKFNLEHYQFFSNFIGKINTFNCNIYPLRSI